MEYGIDKKIKVVWICHFTNIEIQSKLNIKSKVNEFAPWITLGIKEVTKHPEIELHIISPHRWIKKTIEFKVNNICYHFFNSGIPYYGRHWPSFFRWDLITNFKSNRKKILKITNFIKPDIIHWHGAENGYFTSSFFDLSSKYPYIVTIQGFMSLAIYNKSNKSNDITYSERKLLTIENKILTKSKNFGIRDNAMKDEILKYNLECNFYWHEYFINIPENINIDKIEENKIYDIIYFTRIIKSKGIEDLIIALGLIKKTFPNIKLAVLGQSNTNYLIYLKQLAVKNNCLENINFIGFVPLQEDIYKILNVSKLFVLPAYVGDVSGGMIESMVRNIPVVSYKTEGIQEVNLTENNIIIVEQGDINQLASQIKFLLENPSYAKEMAERAYKYAISRWGNQKALSDILIAYNEIAQKY